MGPFPRVALYHARSPTRCLGSHCLVVTRPCCCNSTLAAIPRPQGIPRRPPGQHAVPSPRSAAVHYCRASPKRPSACRPASSSTSLFRFAPWLQGIPKKAKAAVQLAVPSPSFAATHGCRAFQRRPSACRLASTFIAPLLFCHFFACTVVHPWLQGIPKKAKRLPAGPDAKLPQPDPTLLCCAFQRQRLYLFTQVRSQECVQMCKCAFLKVSSSGSGLFTQVRRSVHWSVCKRACLRVWGVAGTCSKPCFPAAPSGHPGLEGGFVWTGARQGESCVLLPAVRVRIRVWFAGLHAAFGQQLLARGCWPVAQPFSSPHICSASQRKQRMQPPAGGCAGFVVASPAAQWHQGLRRTTLCCAVTVLRCAWKQRHASPGHGAPM